MNPISRRSAIALLTIGPIAARASISRAANRHSLVPKILFVCRAGTVKSAIARELFLKRAKERSTQAAAFSRGIAPADHMTALLTTRLTEHGIDPARVPVRHLAQRDLNRADLVILFDPLPGNLIARSSRDWMGQPSFVEQFDLAWPWLDAHVHALLDDLSRQQLESSHG